MSKPILYKANETDFRTLGLGVLADATEAYAIEERNGQFYLEMKYPVNGINFSELKNDRIIKADASHDLKDQRFKIIRITKPAKGVVTVYAEHVSNHTADLQLAPSVGYNGSAQQALNVWRNNIVDEHPFTVYSDITTTGAGRWEVDEVENARRALGGVAGSILDTYGGEYRFDNYHIMLLSQRGNDNGIPIMYGKNLVDLEQEEEIASTYTSVYPYAIHHPEGEEDPIIITLPEHFIDSEHVGKYARRKIQKVNFTADDIETVEQLRARTQRYIRDNDVGVPKVNLRVKFVDLAKTLDYKHLDLVEEINLCDWVVVRFEKLGIKQRAKIIKTTWNILLDRYEEIEVGETRASLTQSIDNVVDGRVGKVEKQVGEVWLQANGKNRSVESYTEPNPANYQKGDIWYRPIADGETEMYRHNGYMWEFVLSTADTTKNARDIAEQQQHIEAAQQKADEAVEQINTAVANAGFTSLDETIGSIQTISSNAQANAQAALGTATNAFTDAQTAIANAQEAVETTQSIDVRVDEVEGILTLKADAQTVDTLAGIVETQGLDIQANAQGLALKANQDTVDTLAGTVSSLGADIGVVAGQISSKVWNTDIETAIDGIEVGGRNLALDSNFDSGEPHGWNQPSYYTENIEGGIAVYECISFHEASRLEKVFSALEVGQEYTLTLYAIIPVSGEWRSFVGANIISEPSVTSSTDKYVKHSITFVPTGTGELSDVTVRLYTPIPPVGTKIYMDWYKLEKGTIATDWTPAPEDTDTKIEHIETEWTQTFDSFSQTVSSIDGRVSTLRVDLDSVSSTVSGHGGRLSTVEQTANGLQSQVFDSNGNSRITQLANGLDMVVERYDKNLIENGDFSNGISGWSSGSNVNISWVSNSHLQAFKTVTNNTTSGTDDRFWTGSLTLQQGKKYRIKFKALTYNDRDISVGQAGGIYMDRITLSTEWQTYEIVYEADRTSAFSIYIHHNGTYLFDDIEVVETTAISKGQISVLENNINLRVTKGDLLSQINIEAGRTLIQSDKLLLNANNTVITGTAWMDGAVIANASLDGAKIINASIGSAKIASLDVNKLSGNTANFVSTAWNSAAGGSVSITGNGIYSYGSDGDNIRIDDGLVRFYDRHGAYTGAIGTSYHMESVTYTGVAVNMEYGNPFAIVRSTSSSNTNNDRILYIPPWDREVQLLGDLRFPGTQSVYTAGSEFMRMHASSTSIYKDINMGNNEINNINRILLAGGAGRIASTGLNIHFGAESELRLGHYTGSSFTVRAVVTGGGIRMQSQLNMNGNNIINQSDERSKFNIRETAIDSLKEIKSMHFVEFDRINGNHDDIGVIAQNTPSLALYDADRDIWSINSSKQIMMNSHAIQQLDEKTEQQIHELSSYTAQALSETQQLREKIEELEREIEKLKGVA